MARSTIRNGALHRKQWAAIESQTQEPIVRYDPETGAAVMQIGDLVEYLEREGLETIRSEWKPGAARPTVYVRKVRIASG